MNLPTENSLIVLDGAEASYGKKTVFTNVHLEIRATSFLGIAGPNGGGKTTLLKVLLGLLKPSRGIVQFPNGRPTMGYLPQQSAFDRSFPINALEVVLSGALGRHRILFSYGKEDRAKATDLLERMGMAHKALQPIGQLSGGERQRVLLARALMTDPQVLVLDEPTTYFDLGARQWMLAELKRQQQERAIVMVSHDMSDLLQVADTIAYVNHSLRLFSTAHTSLSQLEQAIMHDGT